MGIEEVAHSDAAIAHETQMFTQMLHVSEPAELMDLRGDEPATDPWSDGGNEPVGAPGAADLPDDDSVSGNGNDDGGMPQVDGHRNGDETASVPSDSSPSSTETGAAPKPGKKPSDKSPAVPAPTPVSFRKRRD